MQLGRQELMDKIDFKQLFKPYYSPKSNQPEIVDLPAMKYLSLEGHGAPASPGFQLAIQAIYGAAYTIKFSRKKAGQAPDYSLGPLETKWWTPGKPDFDARHPESWQWQALLWQPDSITNRDLAAAITTLQQKKPGPPYAQLRLIDLAAGPIAQVMHIGPYSQEEPTITALRHFITERHRTITGHHHEIYLGDPRRTKPEKLRTIIRYQLS